MAPPFLPQVMPRADARLDFSPISQGLDAIRDQRNKNAMLERQAAEFEFQKEQAGIRNALARQAAGRASAGMSLQERRFEADQAYRNKMLDFERQKFGLDQQKLAQANARREDMLRILGGGDTVQPQPMPAPTLTGDERPGPVAAPQVPQSAPPPQAGILSKMSPQGRQAMLMDYYGTGGKNWGSIIQNDSAKSLTPAQKSIDEQFAKDYGEFVLQGQSFDVAKRLEQLDFAIAEMEKGGTSGFAEGLAANNPAVGSQIFPRAVEVKNAIDEVTQRNLREVLGGQFAQQEGQALIDRAYQPYADEKDNLRRVRRLRRAIANAYKQKLAAVKYFEANGSLAGFKGQIPTLKSIERDAGLVQSNNLNKRPSLAEQSSGVFTLPDGRKARRGKDGSWEMID